MGIVKIVSRRPKSKAGLKRTIRYVLRNDKEELLSAVTGPYANDKVSSDSVLMLFLMKKECGTRWMVDNVHIQL